YPDVIAPVVGGIRERTPDETVEVFRGWKRRALTLKQLARLAERRVVSAADGGTLRRLVGPVRQLFGQIEERRPVECHLCRLGHKEDVASHFARNGCQPLLVESPQVSVALFPRVSARLAGHDFHHELGGP